MGTNLDIDNRQAAFWRMVERLVGAPPMADPANKDAFELVVHCCQWPRSDSLNRQLADRVATADWPRVIALADRHRIAGLVAFALDQVRSQLPSQIADWTMATLDDMRRHTAQRAVQTAFVADALKRAGIDMLVMKGAPITILGYGGLAVKQSRDIDILVDRRCIAKAIAALGRHGFIANFDLSGRRRRRAFCDFRNEIEMHSPTLDILIEPHWRPAIIPGLPADLGKERQQVEIANNYCVETFAHNDLIGYLAIHGAQSRWGRLKWLADFDAMLSVAGDQAIDHLIDHAFRTGVGASMITALAFRARLFDRPMPQRVMDQLRARPALRWLLLISDQQVRSINYEIGYRRLMVFLLVFAAVHRRFWRMLATISVSHDDLQRVGLPRCLYWVYPLMKPLFGLPRVLKRSLT